MRVGLDLESICAKAIRTRRILIVFEAEVPPCTALSLFFNAFIFVVAFVSIKDIEHKY